MTGNERDDLEAANELLQNEIAERRAAEAQIKALFARLVEVQESERRRIARNIHDQFGQQVTALRMNLEVLADRVKHDEVLSAQFARAQKLAEELDRSVDLLTLDLHPAALDQLGLAAALQQLASGWSERFGLAVEFDAGDTTTLRLSRDVESNVYHIAQEALHNVAKHAEATQVSVYLQRHDEELLLVVEDDGRGFSLTPHGRGQGGGLGLVSMRERAVLAGGTIQIESEPGHGTIIFARVPLVATPAGDAVITSPTRAPMPEAPPRNNSD